DREDDARSVGDRAGRDRVDVGELERQDHRRAAEELRPRLCQSGASSPSAKSDSPTASSACAMVRSAYPDGVTPENSTMARCSRVSTWSRSAARARACGAVRERWLDSLPC